MKKVIFIISVVFFLAGCKKEKIEPVENISQDITETNSVLPKMIISSSSDNTRKTYFKLEYNNESLLSKISITDSSSSIANYLIQYKYQDKKVVEKTTSRNNMIELFSYDDKRLKTYHKIIGTSLDWKYEYHYDSKNVMDYFLSKSQNIITDSTSLVYIKANEIMYFEKHIPDPNEPNGYLPYKFTYTNNEGYWDFPYYYYLNDTTFAVTRGPVSISKTFFSTQSITLQKEIIELFYSLGIQEFPFKGYFDHFFENKHSFLEQRNGDINISHSFEFDNLGRLRTHTKKTNHNIPIVITTILTY